jgi:ADP-ribose pyrophosphatase
MKPKVTSRQNLVRNRYLTVYEDKVEWGGQRHDYFWVDVADGVGVVAVNSRDEVCLLKVYRHASGGFYWTIPTGGVEAGEQPLAAGVRELGEEGGVSAKTWRPLGTMEPSPGTVRQVCHIFLATGLTVHQTGHEALELIEVHWQPYTQALAMIEAGELTDAWGVIPLLRAARHVLD